MAGARLERRVGDQAMASELAADLEPPFKAFSTQGDLFIDYYAELRARPTKVGEPPVVLANAGAINQPFTVRVQIRPELLRAELGPPIYKKWWFWTGIGAVLLIGVIGAIVLATAAAACGAEGMIQLFTRASVQVVPSTVMLFASAAAPAQAL